MSSRLRLWHKKCSSESTVKSFFQTVRRKGLPLTIFVYFQNWQIISHACLQQRWSITEHMCENGQSSKFSTNFVCHIPLPAVHVHWYSCLLLPVQLLAAVMTWLAFREETEGVQPKSNQGLSKGHNKFTQLTTGVRSVKWLLDSISGRIEVYFLPMLVCL